MFEGMNNSEKFHHKWDDFSENMRSTLKDDITLLDFTDVTLVCEDGTQIEAHKLVLATGSILLRNILRLKKGPSSIMYMRGMKSKELTSVVEYLYHGEVYVDQEDLNDFLSIARELQVKGLSGLEESEFGDQPKINKNINMIGLPTKIKTEPFEEDFKLSVNVNGVNLSDSKDIEHKLYEMIDTTGKNWTCKICGKEARGEDVRIRNRNLKRHTQVHLTGISYPCNQCGKKYRHKHKLKCHMVKYHSTL